MGITQEQLESKLQLFITKHEELIKVINDNITLSKKLEGAIEAIQLLLTEIQNETNTKDNVNNT
jgi:hypothetical protein